MDLFAEILPLVQFYPEVDITDSEAERLLLAPPKINEDQDPFNEVKECSFIKIQYRNVVFTA